MIVHSSLGIMMSSHCPTPTQTPILRPINCNSTQWDCCLSVVWTPPHNSIQPIFISVCVGVCVGQCEHSIRLELLHHTVGNSRFPTASVLHITLFIVLVNLLYLFPEGGNAFWDYVLWTRTYRVGWAIIIISNGQCGKMMTANNHYEYWKAFNHPINWFSEYPIT